MSPVAETKGVFVSLDSSTFVAATAISLQAMIRFETVFVQEQGVSGGGTSGLCCAGIKGCLSYFFDFDTDAAGAHGFVHAGKPNFLFTLEA